MVFFSIGGLKSCQTLAHVAYIADYLSQNLPNFKYEVISNEFQEWQNWLGHVNKRNKWTHLDSPIIWKTVEYGNRKKFLIGGISEFWEYVFEYYHVDSYLTEEQLEKLVKDTEQFDLLKQYFKKKNMP